jgi:hypothetical protein
MIKSRVDQTVTSKTAVIDAYWESVTRIGCERRIETLSDSGRQARGRHAKLFVTFDLPLNFHPAGPGGEPVPSLGNPKRSKPIDVPA